MDNITLNPMNHQVTLNDELLLLSGKEYQLLYELMRNTGNVVRKHELEQRLFGLDDKIESNSPKCISIICAAKSVKRK